MRRSDFLAAVALAVYVIALAYAAARMVTGSLAGALLGFLVALVVVLGADLLIRLDRR